MVHGPWHHPRISRALTHIIMLNQSVEHVECCRSFGVTHVKAKWLCSNEND